MATKKVTANGLSGETRTIMLPFDGDKYRDPLFVGINGKTWIIQRGEEVEVPVEVYEVIRNSQNQDKKTAMLINDLTRKAAEAVGDT